MSRAPHVVTPATYIDTRTIRVDFDELMLHNAALETPGNYVITGPSTVTVQSASAVDADGVTKVTLALPDTARGSGNFTVLCQNMVDADDGLTPDPSFKTASIYLGPRDSILRHPTLPTGLIAYYKLDGDANDAHTNALHGTAVLTPTWPITAAYCRLRQALQLNGTTQFIWIADNALFESTTGLSVGGWFWIDSTGSDWQALVSKYFWGIPWSNKSWQLIFQVSTNTLQATVAWGPSSGNVWSVTKGSLSALRNAWNHLAFTYDKSNLVLYVNGIEAARTTGCSGNPQDAPVSVYIGSFWDQDSGGRFYSKGYYDEIAIAARGWTAAEMLALYHTGYPLRYAEVPAIDLLPAVMIGADVISSLVANATIPAGMAYERSSHPLARARDVADLSLVGGTCLQPDPEIIYLENRCLPAASDQSAITHSTHPARPQNVGTASGIYIKRRS